jgi:hypothetical protein
MAGALVVFSSRRRKALKCLVFDGQGFWLCQKRLSTGCFAWWPAPFCSIHPDSSQAKLERQPRRYQGEDGVQGRAETLTVAIEFLEQLNPALTCFCLLAIKKRQRAAG